MEGMVSNASFAEFVAKAIGSSFFTLFDVGCSGGIDSGWRFFGDSLRAFGFDPSISEVQCLNDKEKNPHVKFVAGFVGIPADSPGADLAASGHYWDRLTWNRLSVSKTMEIRSSRMQQATDKQKLELNLWQKTELADPKKPIILTHFVEENQVDDIDFVKIDVDGMDFLILRSIESILESCQVLGVGIEVNFFGSDDPNVNTFHNIDRTMRKAGFELFDLSLRRYSIAALPSPYVFAFPAQSQSGRPFQGDALYLRDLAAPEYESSEMKTPQKLMKLAALFSLFGQPDSAAEILTRFRLLLDPYIDIETGLSKLLRQTDPTATPRSYAQYIQEFEADSPRFYPALSKRA